MTPTPRQCNNTALQHGSHAIRRRQEGVIIFFTLIALVLLLIASVALIRSFDTSLTLAGNMAFKRDLLNQSERGVASAIKAVSAGGALALDTTRQSDSFSNNYSATVLSSDAHGIPDVLLDDTLWAATPMTGADIVDSSSNITIRYVIDRLCSPIAPALTAAGPSSTANCAISALGADKSGTYWIKRAGGASLPVYRISIRVTGPRNTRTYVQSTISM